MWMVTRDSVGSIRQRERTLALLQCNGQRGLNAREYQNIGLNGIAGLRGYDECLPKTVLEFAIHLGENSALRILRALRDNLRFQALVLDRRTPQDWPWRNG